jgi:glutamyl-tRNA reductase
MGRNRIAAELPLAVVGCDFRCASTAWRNHLLLDGEQCDTLAGRLALSADVAGFVILQTCNRVEWILSGPRPTWSAELARAQLSERWRTAGLPEPHPTPYMYTGEAAAEHLIRVALGLESFVRGEREIAGQLNKAFDAAQKAGLASPDLNALQTVLGRVVKRVQRMTRFGARARGVHGLALSMVSQHFAAQGLQRPKIAVVGMGEIGRKAAALAEQLAGVSVTRVNRTVPLRQAQHWRQLADLPAIVGEVDALIVATGAREPIVTDVELARAASGLLVVDIGTPNQVAACDVSIDRRGLDDLLVGSAGSDEDIDAVLALAEDAVAEYRMALRKREVAGLLRATQDRYDEFAYQDLPALLRDKGQEPLTPEIRSAVRAYTRQIVAEIERAVGGD